MEEGVSRACRRKGKGGESGLSVEGSLELGLDTTLEGLEGLDTLARPRKPTTA